MPDQKNTISFNLKSLVIDDNAVSQDLAAFILNSLGCKVDVAGDGFEALKKFEENDYDVVFVDLVMPIMDGYQFAEKVIEIMSSWEKKIKIIAITANGSDSDKKLCKKIGIDHYITKPMRNGDIRRALESFFE